MKRISIEEAQGFIPTSEDYYDTPPSYYTIEDSGDGWSSVTYYTHKPRGLFKGKHEDEWVYILENPSMPGLLKIGYTKFDPYTRAAQLTKASGVPESFVVVWAYSCFKGEMIEKEVHKFFDKKRINKNREFFKVTLDEAKNVIEFIGNKYI